MYNHNITLKLGNMRKAEEWVVYPVARVNMIQIQSPHRICLIDIALKKALLSKYHANGSYNYDLHLARGATYIDISDELINQLLALQPKSGDALFGSTFVFAA